MRLLVYYTLFFLPSLLFSQHAILQKRISLQLNNISRADAILAVADASGTQIQYSNSQIDEQKKLNFSFQNKTVEAALKSIFAERLESIQVVGNQLTIRFKKQTYRVTGKVVDKEASPIRYATIYLDGKAITQTKQDGSFSFRATAGKQQLQLVSLGFGKLEQAIDVSSLTKPLDLVLSPDESTIQTIEIVGRKESAYRNSSTFSGTKTEMSLKEIPQSISYVTKETMEDQLAFKVSDVIKNVSGVNQLNYNNRDFVIRGFASTSKLMNGQRVVTEIRSQTMLPNIERVEVLKGPVSMLYANADPGGTINLVTKKPLDEDRKSIQFATGSFNTFRLSTDFTGPMNEEKTLLYRLNAAYQDVESFRDLQGGKFTVIAPSFSFLPNPNTRFNVDILYQMNDTKLDRGQPIFGGNAQEDLYSTPISFAIGKRSDFSKELFFNSTVSLQHKFTNWLTFNSAFTRSTYEEDLMEHRATNAYAVDVEGNEIPTLVGMQVNRRQNKNHINNLSSFFNMQFKTAALAHTLLIGHDYIEEIFPTSNATDRASGFLSADGTKVINSYDPATPELYLIENGVPVPNVPYFDLTNPDYGMASVNDYITRGLGLEASRYYLHGLYVQDQIKYDKFQLLIGLRQEYYTDVSDYGTVDARKVQQSAFVPRFGLVYTPNNMVSFYGSYAQGYQPQSAGVIGNAALYGGPFDPLTSESFEVGAKFDFLNKKLSLNTAIYNITQNNILISAQDASNPDLLRQIGEQRARGVELDLYGQILSNLSVTAAFSYNHAKIVESENAAEVGQDMPNAPRSQGNVWLKYNVVTGKLKGVGIAFGSNYATTRNMSDLGAVKLPAYAVVNGALYYQIDKFRLTCTLNNLLNETYWVGAENITRLFPGTPRSVLFGVGYNF